MRWLMQSALLGLGTAWHHMAFWFVSSPPWGGNSLPDGSGQRSYGPSARKLVEPLHTSFVLFSRGYRIEDTEQRNKLSRDKGRTGTVRGWKWAGLSWVPLLRSSVLIRLGSLCLGSRDHGHCVLHSMYCSFVVCDKGVKDDLAVLAKVGFKVRVMILGKGIDSCE